MSKPTRIKDDKDTIVALTFSIGLILSVIMATVNLPIGILVLHLWFILNGAISLALKRAVFVNRGGWFIESDKWAKILAITQIALPNGIIIPIS